jgi:protein-tyrosine kinase
MGKYFKALEQAERELALRQEAQRRATQGETHAAVPAPAREEPPHAATVPVLRPPAQASEPASVRPRFPRPALKERRPSPAPAQEIPATTPEVSTDLHGKVAERLVSLLNPASFGAEQYRALRHKLEELHKSAKLTVVGVSSPEPGDGKTVTALNLAGALAQSPETRVLVIDADFRGSSMSEYLGLDGSRARGLVGAILDPELSLKDVVESYPPFNFSVLQTGRRPSSPYEILRSPRLARLLNEARQQYDYVILDMPPLAPLPDCSVIGPTVDGFLVVVGANKTKGKRLTEALRVVDPTAVIGLVFNGDDQAPHRYYGHARRPSRRRRPSDD